MCTFCAYTGAWAGADAAAPLFRVAQGTYFGELSISNEIIHPSSETAVIQSTVRSITNMTFVMDMHAIYNPKTLGTDCTINATMVSCSAAIQGNETTGGSSEASGTTVQDCIKSCTLVLFNHAAYTATFSQSPDGSFNASTFRIIGGVRAQKALKKCGNETEAINTALATKNMLKLLAEQVDTRYGEKT